MTLMELTNRSTETLAILDDDDVDLSIEVFVIAPSSDPMSR